MKVTEFTLGPQVHAAFPGIAMSQFNHSDSLRPEKKHEGNEPKPNCNSAIRRNAGHNVQVEYRYDEQRDKIPAPKRAL